jgi:hypothetical protein
VERVVARGVFCLGVQSAALAGMREGAAKRTVIGYFDGYCVVYDPVTFAILSLVDLLD